MDDVIEIRGLTRSYGEGTTVVRALRGIDLRIRAGEFVAVVGPSGAGKSTLLNQLGLLDEPTSGSYRIRGLDLTEFDADQRAAERSAQIGFVFQHFHLLAHRTVLENVLMGYLYSEQGDDGDRRAEAAAMLARVGLGSLLDATPDRLSGGERQRVAIARALVNRPALLLCDEPTGNLDRVNSDLVLDLLSDLAASGQTVVVVTHDREVSSRAGRVVEIVDGVVASDQTAGPARRARMTPDPEVSGPDRAGRARGVRLWRWRRAFVEASCSLASRPGRFVSLSVGVAVGCAALVATSGIAAGAGIKVYEQFDRLAGTFAEATVARGELGAPLRVEPDLVRRVCGIAGVLRCGAMLSTGGRDVIVADRSIHGTSVSAALVGVTPGAADVLGATVIGDGGRIAAALGGAGDEVVLGSYVAERLSVEPSDVADGGDRFVLVDGRPLRVIGVLGRTTRHRELESAVLVPAASSTRFGAPTSLGVLVETAIGAVGSVAEQLPVAVDPARPDGVDVARAGDPQDLRSDVGSTLSFLMVAVGALSMLLGAFGIMNSLAASVSQRIGEIGLRRALGATTSDISMQFLTEAALVGLFGGAVGAAIGAAASWAASLIGDFPTAVDATLVMVSPFAGVLVGCIAGIVPARRAALVQPAGALRSGV